MMIDQALLNRLDSNPELAYLIKLLTSDNTEIVITKNKDAIRVYEDTSNFIEFLKEIEDIDNCTIIKNGDDYAVAKNGSDAA